MFSTQSDELWRVCARHTHHHGQGTEGFSNPGSLLCPFDSVPSLRLQLHTAAGLTLYTVVIILLVGSGVFK